MPSPWFLHLLDQRTQPEKVHQVAAHSQSAVAVAKCTLAGVELNPRAGQSTNEIPLLHIKIVLKRNRQDFLSSALTVNGESLQV